jgi:hypothetical protein
MNHRYITLTLLSGCLSGCVAGSRGNVTNRSNDVSHAIHPEYFTASIGGLLGASYRVELQADGTLLYLHNPRTFTSLPGTKRTRIKVTEEQWHEFRQNLDTARVWTWRKDYTDPNVLDGTQWHLRIKYEDVSASSHGSNAFPRKQDFERFRTALVKLLNGRDFR